MQTTLIIDGTSYDSAARAAAGIFLNELRRTLEGYDSFAFCVRGGSPTLEFARNKSVEIQVQYAAEPATTKFKGLITDTDWQFGQFGWIKAYNCQGLRYLADRVPISAPDGTGLYVLNRSPSDEYYTTSDAGLTVGEIFTRVLTVQETADALDALGIGGYTSLSPPTLPTATTDDLALLTVVPPTPVQFSGNAILNTLAQVLAKWHPKYCAEIQPDGVLRFKDSTSATVFVPATVVLPTSANPTVHDVGALPPSIRASIHACATRVRIRGGPNVAVALLSTSDGTLVRTWTNTDETNWHYTDFSQPKDASDYGIVTANTSNTATVKSHDALRTYTTNFWPGRDAKLYLQSSITGGVTGTESRDVTANTSMSAGGTCTVTWDASNPVTATTFDSFRIVGTSGGLIDVGRRYSVREPATGHTGLNTYIGSHLVAFYPREIVWANYSTTLGIYAPTGLIVSSGGATIPWSLEPVISEGEFLFRQPVVAAFGGVQDLTTNGWPTTGAKGLPSDVQVLALYSKGPLQAVVPADVGGVPQYEGTANTVDGLELTYTAEQPGWLLDVDTSSMGQLAQEYLDTMKDVVYEGSGEFIGTPPWNFLDFETSINYDVGVPGHEFLSMNAAIRSVSCRWNVLNGGIHSVSFQFSNARRPFTGDQLYQHPQFRSGSLLDNAGSLGGMAAMGGMLASYSQGLVGQALGGFTSGFSGMSMGPTDGMMGQEQDRDYKAIGKSKPPQPKPKGLYEKLAASRKRKSQATAKKDARKSALKKRPQPTPKTGGSHHQGAADKRQRTSARRDKAAAIRQARKDIQGSMPSRQAPPLAQPRSYDVAVDLGGRSSQMTPNPAPLMPPAPPPDTRAAQQVPAPKPTVEPTKAPPDITRHADVGDALKNFKFDVRPS